MDHLEHLRIPLTDILTATDNFSEKYCIGFGGYAIVYKAELCHFDGIASEVNSKAKLPERHSTVAVKVIRPRKDEQGKEGFFAELETLSNSDHPNIVPLLGFCYEDGYMILVLEYAPNGSLDNIFDDSNYKINLTWAQRLQICLDIAHGLHYLHSITMGKQMIIHRDIKSANILLNENMVAKIADFGLCKLNHAYQHFSSLHSNRLAGTEMYMDPAYYKTGRLKKESDVYSF
ncbi:putative protein kinase RLK-Pelle-L-LEC family [Helianthus anomalus]